jgi:hypothetical protein
VHDVMSAVNIYGDSALVNHKIDRPLTTTGKSVENNTEYNYWDNVDYIVDLARKKGIYIAMVPVWGSNVRKGYINCEQAGRYARWLAARYKDKPNVIWINGGDNKGNDSTAVWNTIGMALKEISPEHLVTYHPFGRTQSSIWFHNEPWLDFNMFQSGHRRYDQDDTPQSYGEDNWRYAADDYLKVPVKPTIDGEPSYEAIPQGLHDSAQPYWTDADVRRYAYWSVFAGCFGFTYGHNAIMQFYKPGDSNPAYGVKEYWDVALNAPGAAEMKYLERLILSKPFFERIPGNDLLAGFQGERYDYIAVTRGKDWVLAYTWNGRNISLDINKLALRDYKASWFDPRNGELSEIGTYKNEGTASFNPPGEQKNGNDWVLIIEGE